MPNTLIGKVEISPRIPRPAQSFKVEVFDENGISYSEQHEVAVYIEGVPGASRYLQATQAGKRPTFIRVQKGEESESLEMEITVVGSPLTFRNNRGIDEPAMLSVEQILSSPYEVSFTLGNPPPRSGGPRANSLHQKRITNDLEQLFDDNTRNRSRLARAIIGNENVKGFTTQKTTINRLKPLLQQFEVTTGIVDLGGIDPEKLLGEFEDNQANFEWEWDFGDGTKKKTASPQVNHDYSGALTANDGILHFDVSCRSVEDNIVVTRTLVLYSAYVLCKNRGYIVPPVRAGIYAHKAPLSFYGELEVTNLEPMPLTLTHQAIIPLTDNPDAHERPVFRQLEEPIKLPPLSTTVIGVYPPHQASSAPGSGIPFPTEEEVTPVAFSAIGVESSKKFQYGVPENAPGFTVYFAGRSADLKPVRFTHVFEIHMDERSKRPIDIPDARHDKQVSPWEEVETIGEILTQELAQELGATPLNVTIAKDIGIIAVSVESQRFRGKNTPLKIAARHIAQVGRAVMENFASKSLHITPRDTTEMQETKDLSEALPSMEPEEITPISKQTIDPKAFQKRLEIVNSMTTTTFSTDYGTMLRFSRSGPPQPGMVLEGEVCAPDNMSLEEHAYADAQQLVCQLSDEKMEVLMPGRFMNGRKGDIVLSPGGPGLIGSLLREVNPSQKYSHSGIMTRNYDEVTHSTASEERILEYLEGVFDGTDGVRPDILKWMWPGIVTQKVEAAVNGKNEDGEELMWTDPESGKLYKISSFSPHNVGLTHNDDFQIIPPLIVKPDPMLETNQVRQFLHEVAASARADGAMIDKVGRLIKPTRGHYRLFCYTDPTIGLDDVAPPESKWASGTYPSVCSSFIWMTLKKHGIRLEGDSLERTDTNEGANVVATTKDGLYRYEAKERLDAAIWLKNEIHHKVYDKTGWGTFIEPFTDAADDLANQMVNTFALDDAEGKHHDDWKDMQDASAVSPDNILFWDGPSKGGLYGYPEPLIYREPRVETYTVSRWKKVLTRGQITGIVRLDGRPVSGATVSLYDGMSDLTDENGAYSMSEVPFGSYELTASKVIKGVYYSAKVNIHLNQAVSTFNIDLEPPADHYRLAVLRINFWGKDSEQWPIADEIIDPGREEYQLELGPDRTINRKYREYRWGGEVRVEYDFKFSLLADLSINVDVRARLYEGTSESTDQLEDTASMSFNVPKDKIGPGPNLSHYGSGFIQVINSTATGKDIGQLFFTVRNIRNNN